MLGLRCVFLADKCATSRLCAHRSWVHDCAPAPEFSKAEAPAWGVPRASWCREAEIDSGSDDSRGLQGRGERRLMRRIVQLSAGN